MVDEPRGWGGFSGLRIDSGGVDAFGAAGLEAGGIPIGDSARLPE